MLRKKLKLINYHISHKFTNESFKEMTKNMDKKQGDDIGMRYWDVSKVTDMSCLYIDHTIYRDLEFALVGNRSCIAVRNFEYNMSLWNTVRVTKMYITNSIWK